MIKILTKSIRVLSYILVVGVLISLDMPLKNSFDIKAKALSFMRYIGYNGYFQANKFDLNMFFDKNNSEKLPYGSPIGPVPEDEWVVSLQNLYWLDAAKSHFAYNQSTLNKMGLKLDINLLLSSATTVDEKINLLSILQQDKLFNYASIPSIWPVQGWISSEFGWRHPFRTRTGGRSSAWHTGIDIASSKGTPIIAAGNGKVVSSGYMSGYGKTLIIDHGNNIETLYAHCSKLYVKKGDTVSRGDIIAAIGSTGRSTGPHIHFEVKVNGVRKNPLDYIK